SACEPSARASPWGSRGAAIRPLSSSSSRSAVFLPMLGTRVRRATSWVATARPSSSTDMPESSERAMRAPTPETRISWRNASRSSSVRKPKSRWASSRTTRWVRRLTGSPTGGSSKMVLIGASTSYPTPPTSTSRVGGRLATSLPESRPIMEASLHYPAAADPGATAPDRGSGQAGRGGRAGGVARRVYVADRAGECVGGIGGRRPGQHQQALDHGDDLALGGMPVAHDGLLELQGAVLVHRQPRDDHRGDRGAPRLAEQQGRGRIDVDEHLLDRAFVRPVLGDDLGEPGVDDAEPGGEVGVGRADGSAGDVGEASRLSVDEAEAGAPQPRVDTEDDVRGRAGGRGIQCRKWRTPVNTIAMPRSLAAAMTSSSRTEPPGWITQAAPASTTTSRPSRNGKNASEATAEPASDSAALLALIEAMRAESIRLIWPAPTPSVCPLPQKTMAFDFTNLATRQAKSRSASCACVGSISVTTRSSSAARLRESSVCTSSPPPTRLKSNALPPGARGISSRRTFCLAANTARAPSANPGAMSTSTNWRATSAAVSASSGRLNAMMPPKAEVGSVEKAFA